MTIQAEPAKNGKDLKYTFETTLIQSTSIKLCMNILKAYSEKYGAFTRQTKPKYVLKWEIKPTQLANSIKALWLANVFNQALNGFLQCLLNYSNLKIYSIAIAVLIAQRVKCRVLSCKWFIRKWPTSAQYKSLGFVHLFMDKHDDVLECKSGSRAEQDADSRWHQPAIL